MLRLFALFLATSLAPAYSQAHDGTEAPGPAEHTSPEAIHDFAERSPELIGGLEGLATRVTYPVEAAREGIQGTVYVQFVVETDGSVTEAQAVRGPEPLSEAATRAVENSRFVPGAVGGRTVRTRHTLPVRFVLTAPEPAPLPMRNTAPIRTGEGAETEPVLIGGLEGLEQRVVYPEEARRAGIEGTVFVEFLINEAGLVLEARAIRGDAALAPAAVEAVSNSRFHPANQDGRLVQVRMTLPVRFVLR